MSEDITPKDFVEVLKRRVKKDWDAVVGITGEEGSSKSTIASWLVYESCIYDGMTEEEALKKFIDYTIFSPNKERVKQQITESARYSVINADEAIKILYKQNWASPLQKFLNMFYALCRQENKISLLCMPRFLDFNEFFRNHRIKFWVHVIDRGVAVVFEKDWFPFTDDPWFLKEAQKYKYALYHRKHTGDFNTEQKVQSLSKLKNFLGVIRFNDLPNTLKKVYRDGKAQYAYADIEEQVKSEYHPSHMAEKYKGCIVRAIKDMKERGMNQTDIARVMGVTPKTIVSYLQIDENELPTTKNRKILTVPTTLLNNQEDE